MNLSRHPLLLSGRSFVKLSVLPMAFRLLGKQFGLPSKQISGVERFLITESINQEYPAVLTYDRNCLPARSVAYPEAEVYRIEADLQQNGLRVLDVGALYLNNKYMLACGMHHSAGLLASCWKNRKPVREVCTLVLPWAHPWWSFGDFMLHVLPFFCRIWSVMDSASRANAVIGLHGIEANAFAYDFYELLGVQREQIIDLSRYKVELKKGAQVWTANGVPYTAYTAHPDDLSLVRSMIGSKVPSVAGADKIYVSRRGQRKYLQEPELVPVLKNRGYMILEDVPRPAKEQIQIFKAAKHIVGPHGAAFGNLLFSENTSLVEFQHPGWVQPGVRYLCHLMGHRYDVAVASKGKLRREPTQGFQQCDVDIPVDCILKQLDNIGGD